MKQNTNVHREKLQEEGKLRTDIDINYDGDDTPASWDDLKTKIKIAMHPELKDKFEAEASFREFQVTAGAQGVVFRAEEMTKRDKA